MSQPNRPSLKARCAPLLILPTVAALLSGVMAWANVGLSEVFASTWLRGFVSSVLMLPVVLWGLSRLEVGVAALCPQWPPVVRKVVVSLLTACAIESVLALAATAINAPWEQGFAGYWWLAFSRSFPAGVVVGLFMAFYLKPRLDQLSGAHTPTP
ncbi:MAG: hypothetical protein RJA09_1063 [Pseudomonadota bacterium]